MTLFGDHYRGRRVLLTGHTGFKGSWLALWLSEMGAEVVGVAHEPHTAPNHWQLLNLQIDEHLVDVRDTASLAAIVRDARPEMVFHLAAQALVRSSYQDPLGTWSANVMGTASVLEVCRASESVRGIVVVTSDKCYENREWEWGYRELDVLGGHDPYSASKAAAELVASSYRRAFFERPGSPLLATARAGNVIGGGDWSEDRLVPDLVRAVSAGTSLEVRSPRATRPWQHVLESLSGYLLLGQRLLYGNLDCADCWNFGPAEEGKLSVGQVLSTLETYWPMLSWHVTDKATPHEANFLFLDSSKAHSRLGWRPVWPVEKALEATAAWYRAYQMSGKVASREQLAEFTTSARDARAPWACS